MATALTIQVLPNNGVALDDLVWTAADAGGMSFSNSSVELLLARGSLGVTTGGVVQGIPSADSGRDGTAAITPGDGEISMAGPFKARNFNVAGAVEVTVASVTGLEFAAVRFDPRG